MSSPTTIEATTIGQLNKESETYAKEIQRIISNYSKDSSDRKSSAKYYEERIHRLDSAWSVFESIDQVIRSLDPPPLDHSYFTNNTYDQILSLYNQYSKLFRQKAAEFKALEGASSQLVEERTLPQRKVSNNEEPKETGTQKPPQKASLAPPQAKGAQLPIVKAPEISEVTRVTRRQQAIITSLRRILNNLNDADPTTTPKGLYQLKYKSIEHHWAQVEECHNTIFEIIEDPTTDGYNLADYLDLEEEVQEALVRLSDKLEQLPTQADIHSQNMSGSPIIQLPRVTLPKFDGDYLK